MDINDPVAAQSPRLHARFASLIWEFLDAGLSRTAVFYAERFFALDNTSHAARHLYCRALIDEKQYFSALALVNQDRVVCAACCELKARCSSILGRHRQAREALEQTIHLPAVGSLITSSSRASTSFPSAAAMHCRSGQMALKGNLLKDARGSFVKALELNPLIWEAFEGLCTLGSVPPVDQLIPPRQSHDMRVFKEDPALFSLGFSNGSPSVFHTPDGFRHHWSDLAHPQPFRFKEAAPFGPRDSLATEASFQFTDISFQQPVQRQPTRQAALNAPGPTGNFGRPLSSADETGPDRKKLRSDPPRPPEELSKKTAARTGSSSMTNNRRSTRLLTGGGSKSGKTIPRERRRQTTVRSKSPDSEHEDMLSNPEHFSQSPPPVGIHMEQSPPADPSYDTLSGTRGEDEQADSYIYELLRRFAKAARSLAHYQCQECIDELSDLPPRHQQSPYVLVLVGRAHYEKLDYSSAERAFQGVRSLDPFRLWDMEVYSTLLWHLQRTVELSFLAQELVNIDPSSPQTWIAIGNLFSLQKDRTQALACFRRATELDPTCAYGFTLSGHECIDEDLQKAIQFFQRALRADPRHYNAWYGLGTCYLRMSKLRLAEYHYRQSANIHPMNAVLLGCVGMTVERKGDLTDALALYDRAVEIAPDNALARYRRSKLLIYLKRYKDAIKDLEMLRNATPEEANVVFQLAKAYRLIGDTTKSAQTLAVVRDMAPRHLNKIRKLLETVPDDSTDQMEEG
ncbi:hypothetical protein DL96DRAFT_1577418 [Flagelloscypha sp. PMI_526]|nr:hypothetical protein DL96DRAFT_1577418 [Flagelloscypha sp. PMI_526]